MHILLMHQIFVTPERGGGTRHYELAKYLVELGHEVTVIASDVDYMSGSKIGRKRESREGITIIYARTPAFVHRNILFRALSFLTFSLTSFFEGLKVKKVDVIWATSPPLFQSITSALLSVFKRKKLLFEVRDLWLDFAQELGVVRNRFVLDVFRFLEKMVYGRAHKVMVNSPGFIPFVSRHVSADDVIFIPNGVISEDFSEKGDSVYSFRKKINAEDRFIVSYTGNMGVANDLESIIAAAEEIRNELPDVLFLFVGGGMKGRSLAEQCSAKGLDNVLFIPPVSKTEVPSVLHASDVCIATLKNIKLFTTVYPNKVFDYMAAKKPIILAIEGVIKDVIENSGGGICVTPGDSRGIGDAVRVYYRDRDRLVNDGTAAYLYVKKHFERKVIAEKLSEKLSEEF